MSEMSFGDQLGSGSFLLERDFELVSGSRSPTTTWTERIDPVHEIKWQDMISRSWSSMECLRNTLRIDSTGRLVHDIARIPSPIQMSGRDTHSAAAVMAVAMLNEWNQLSTHQLSTLMGVSKGKAAAILWKLYCAGIVKRLIPGWWQEGISVEQSGSGSFWRLDRKSWTTEKWVNDLDSLEWALLTHGEEITATSIGANSPQAIRHNIATVEIAIKAMEVIPSVIGSWGESKVAGSNFYDSSKLHNEEMFRNNIGDAAILTRDGKIIVLETTGTNSTISTVHRSNPLVNKAAAWTSICGRTDLDLYVVFVDISRKQRHERVRNWVDFGVKSHSERYITNKQKRERGQSRVLVADTRHWFPLPRTVSTDFTNLRCYSTIHDAYVDLADVPADADPASHDHVVNCLSSLHTPNWIHHDIRQGHR